MKRILLVMVAILGMVTVNAQGYLGSSKAEIQENAVKYGWVLKYDTLDSGTNYIQMTNSPDNVSWVFFLNDENIVSSSILDLLTPQAMGEYLQAINNVMAQMSPKEWRSYQDWGVIYAKLTPETEDRYPYLTFTFETY